MDVLVRNPVLKTAWNLVTRDQSTLGPVEEKLAEETSNTSISYRSGGKWQKELRRAVRDICP